MYRKQVRRRRAVLVLLVVAAIVLVSTHFSEGDDGPLHSAQSGVATVLSPVGEALDRALKPARDLVGWFDETFEARGENDELREEVEELRAQFAKAQAAVGENKRLREIVDFNETADLSSYDPVTARVIGRSPTVWYSTVTIDKGSSSGISRGDPVVDGSGLVGSIGDVATGIAEIQLLTDHRSAVSAKVLPDGPAGLIKAEVGRPGTLLLDFVEDDRRVRDDSVLVTAGWAEDELSSRFPFGIRIGRVSSVGDPARETFQRITVKPSADLRDLEIVEVLASGRGG